MDTSKPNMSSLRQRMVEDMRMRKLAPKTQAAYIRAVRKFAKYLGRSPDTATDEDLRRFQLHLVDQGASPITLNATIVGLNFLFEVSLGRPELMAKMQSVRVTWGGVALMLYRYAVSETWLLWVVGIALCVWLFWPTSL